MIEQNIRGYRKLKVYEEVHKLIKMVYDVTKNFPKSEIFGLISQMRRAAVSVTANIIEGYVRGSKEFRQFLVIANGSLTELEYYLDLSFDLGYLDKNQYEELSKQRVLTGSLLGGLIKAINKKLNS